MRAYHKGWQSDRPLKRTSRRVKWYEGEVAGKLSIRLEFLDEDLKMNEFYYDREKATADFEAFVAGTLTCAEVLRRHSGRMRELLNNTREED
jgi:hypothetical protein